MLLIYFILDFYFLLYCNNENLLKRLIINCIKVNYYLWINYLYVYLNEKCINLIEM